MIYTILRCKSTDSLSLSKLLLRVLNLRPPTDKISADSVDFQAWRENFFRSVKPMSSILQSADVAVNVPLYGPYTMGEGPCVRLDIGVYDECTMAKLSLIYHKVDSQSILALVDDPTNHLPTARNREIGTGSPFLGRASAPRIDPGDIDQCYLLDVSLDDFMEILFVETLCWTRSRQRASFPTTKSTRRRRREPKC